MPHPIKIILGSIMAPVHYKIKYCVLYIQENDGEENFNNSFLLTL
jgi:hypothetical protein